MIMIRCPSTGAEVSTGLGVDRYTFETLPEVEAEMRCAVCGQKHRWSRSQAWLEGSARKARLRVVEPAAERVGCDAGSPGSSPPSASRRPS
jgi:hypothetical protein